MMQSVRHFMYNETGLFTLPAGVEEETVKMPQMQLFHVVLPKPKRQLGYNTPVRHCI